MLFYDWLQRQRGRRDVVGDYARQATRDKTYPRKSQLHIILLHARGDEAERRRAKAAHREWRQARKAEEKMERAS